MVEITVRVTERQLAEMDRMLSSEGVRGSQWLKDAVAIYKSVLVARKGRFDGPARRVPFRPGLKTMAG